MSVVLGLVCGASVVFVSACGEGTGGQTYMDAGRDAGRDAGTDSKPDTGVDAAADAESDVYALDGGSDDSAEDGGFEDGGPEDMGYQDTGTTDGGTMDAGTADAGADDAGPEDGGPADAAGADAGAACGLTASGPVVAAKDGQVIENLRITSKSGAAVTVDGRSGVTIRNCEIRHKGGPGIRFSNAKNILVENVAVVHDGAPAAGKNSSEEQNNISGESSTGVVIRRVRLEKGSSGIYLDRCPAARVAFVDGHDFRGPIPRGQLVQFNNCDGAILEDFSCENPQATSWPEDNVSVFQSAGVTVRRGLLDGNNAPTGVGVMFEQSDGSSGGLVEDVDAVRMGNGCFSGYPARGVVFRRTGCRDNICTDQGRGEPASGGLAWAGSPQSSNLRIEASKYFDLCAGLVWDESVFDAIQLDETDFTPRPPLRLDFCWER